MFEKEELKKKVDEKEAKMAALRARFAARKEQIKDEESD